MSGIDLNKLVNTLHDEHARIQAQRRSDRIAFWSISGVFFVWALVILW